MFPEVDSINLSNYTCGDVNSIKCATTGCFITKISPVSILGVPHRRAKHVTIKVESVCVAVQVWTIILPVKFLWNSTML